MVLLSDGASRINNYRKCVPLLGEKRQQPIPTNSEKSFCKQVALTEAVHPLLSCDLLHSVFVLFISKNPS